MASSHYRYFSRISFGFVIAVYLFIVYILQSPYANGKDGYWYAIQMQSLMEKGRLHSYESTLLYAIYRFYQIIFHDYIVSLRHTLALTSVFCSVSLYALYSSLHKWMRADKPALSLPFTSAIFLFFLLSPTVWFLAVQYPKQSLGLSFLFLSIAMLLPLLHENSPTPRAFFNIKNITKLAAAVLFIVSLLSHRLIPVFVFAFVSIFGVIYAALFFKTVKHIKQIAAGVLTALLLFAVVLSFFPGVLNILDIRRLTTAKSFYIVFLRYLQFQSYHPIAVLETALPFFGAMALWSDYKNNRPEKPGLFATFLSISLFCIFFHLPLFDFFDLQIRLYAGAILLSYASLALLPLPSFPVLSKRPRIVLITMYSILAASFLHALLRFYQPQKFEHDYKTFENIRETVNLQQKEKPILTIAHTGFAQFYEFSTGRQTLPWSPEPEFDRKQTFRFAFGISTGEFMHRLLFFSRELPEDYKTHIISCGDYLYVREDLWEIFLKTRALQYDERLEQALESWKNPMRVRPSYLFR